MHHWTNEHVMRNYKLATIAQDTMVHSTYTELKVKVRDRVADGRKLHDLGEAIQTGMLNVIALS